MFGKVCIKKMTQIVHDALRHGGNGSCLSVCSKVWRLEANVHDRYNATQKGSGL